MRLASKRTRWSSQVPALETERSHGGKIADRRAQRAENLVSLFSSSATVWMLLELTFRPLSFTKLVVRSPLKPGLCSRTAEYVAIVPANGPLSTPDEEEMIQKEKEKIGQASEAEMSKIIGDGRRFCQTPHPVRPSPSASFGVVALPARFQGHKTGAAAVDPAAAYCVAVTSGGRLAASSSQASSCP